MKRENWIIFKMFILDIVTITVIFIGYIKLLEALH